MNKLLFISLLVVSCATLSPMAKSVRIADVSQSSLLGACKNLGPLTGGSEHGRLSARIEFKNAAAKGGANVVLSRLDEITTVGFFNETILFKGVMFHCPDTTLQKIIDIDAL